MASILPMNFEMLKQQAAAPNAQLSQEQKDFIDAYISSLGPSGTAPAAAPKQTKAVRSGDVEGRRAYVMQEGPVVYADRPVEPAPQAATAPVEPAPAAVPATAPAPAPAQAQVAAPTVPDAVIQNAVEQVNPEVTGLSTPVYQSPAIPASVMPLLPRVQDLSARQMASIPALAGPGGGRTLAATQDEIPPPPASQKVVTIPDQKRQRRAGVETAPPTQPAVPPSATAPAAPKATTPPPATTPAPQTTAPKGKTQPPSATPPAVAPKTPVTPEGSAEQAPAEPPRGAMYWYDQMYPEKTPEQMQQRVDRAVQEGEPKERYQETTPELPMQTWRRPAQAKPPVQTPKPAEQGGTAQPKPTSALPPTFQQLKQNVQAATKVSPIKYADMGDVSWTGGSMQVEVGGGNTLPLKKSPSGWQVQMDDQWVDVDKNTPLYDALQKSTSSAQSAFAPVATYGKYPLYGDPETGDDYNLGSEQSPMPVKMAIGPGLVPQFIDSRFSVGKGKSIGDYREVNPETQEQGFPEELVRPLRKAHTQAVMAYQNRMDNYTTLLGEDGKPKIASYTEAVGRLSQQLDPAYNTKVATTGYMQKQEYGDKIRELVKSVLKQLFNRNAGLMGMAAALQEVAAPDVNIDIAALTSTRARSSGGMQESQSASGSVSDIGVDIDYVLEQQAESMVMNDVYQGSTKFGLALDSGYRPGTMDQDYISPNMFAAYARKLYEAWPDRLKKDGYKALQNPAVNPDLFYKTVKSLQQSKDPQAPQQLADFLTATVGQDLEITGGQPMAAKVKPYNIGVTAIVAPESTNIQGSGAAAAKVERSESAPSAGRARVPSGSPRDAENNTFKSVDEALATYSTSAPKSMDTDARNMYNLLAYMKDPSIPSASIMSGRADAALRGLRALSDTARTRPDFNKTVGNAMQGHMNTLLRNIALLSSQYDERTKESKLTTKVAQDFLDGVKLVYGNNLPQSITVPIPTTKDSKPGARRMMNAEELKAVLASANSVGLDYVNADLSNNPGVQYVANSIKGYSNPAGFDTTGANADTAYQQLGASTFGASEFVRNIYTSLGLPYADAQSTKSFINLMMARKSASTVEGAIESVRKGQGKEYITR